MKQTIKIISLIAIIFFIIADLIFLNWKVLQNKKEESLDLPVFNQTNTLPTPSSDCSLSCLSKIYEATSSLQLIIPSSKPQPTPVSQSTIKEIFIPLGLGSSRANDWESLDSAQVYFDAGKYGKIKSVVFETIVHIPNGNQGVFLRLFNVTDNHPVWYSDVYEEGGGYKLLTSKPIILDSGNKLYEVQMKTTLSDLAVLDLARIRITSE